MNPFILGIVIVAGVLGLVLAAIVFSLVGAFVKALFATFFGRAARFVVTPKTARRASLRPVVTLLLVSVALVVSAVYGVVRMGPGPSVVNNVAWVIAHLVILQGFIRFAIRPTQAPQAGSDPASGSEVVAHQSRPLIAEAEAGASGDSVASTSAAQDWGVR